MQQWKSMKSRPFLSIKSAFTLIELLVSIAILAILIALLIPALSLARQGAIASTCYQHQRSCYQAVLLYLNDSDGMYPMFAKRDLRNGLDLDGFPSPYFYQTMHWPKVVRPYMNDQQLEETQICPGSDEYKEAFRGDLEAYLKQYSPTYTLPSDYWLSWTLFSDPKYWQPGTDRKNPALLRGVRQAEVLFPSDKGAMVEARVYHLSRVDEPNLVPSLEHNPPDNGPYPTIFVDGHLQIYRLSEMQPGYKKSPPILGTLNGVRGRDVAK